MWVFLALKDVFSTFDKLHNYFLEISREGMLLQPLWQWAEELPSAHKENNNITQTLLKIDVDYKPRMNKAYRY